MSEDMSTLSNTLKLQVDRHTDGRHDTESKLSVDRHRMEGHTHLLDVSDVGSYSLMPTGWSIKLIERNPFSGGVSYLLCVCSLIKNPEEEDPLWCFEGGTNCSRGVFFLWVLDWGT